MPDLHIDLETRSTVDLRVSGVYVYAEHDSTDVWCACFCVDDGPVRTWLPGEPIPAELEVAIAAGWPIYAHNANFERTLWHHVLAKRYGWPEPALEQWRCTMVMALEMGLPGSLENAAGALGLDVQKDMKGRSLMLRMAKPRSFNPLVWWDDEERLGRLIDYCKTDVEVERTLTKKLLQLRPSELRLWQLDQRINDRGIAADLPLARTAAEIVDRESARLRLEMQRVTSMEVRDVTNVADLIGWVRGHGHDVSGLTKGDVDDLLSRPEVAGNVRRALELRKEGGLASVKKLKALMQGTSGDGRMRGLLQFYGAGTGRWAGRRYQPQNMKRPDLDEEAIEAAIDDLALGADSFSLLHSKPISVVADCLRGMLVAAPGKVLAAADFANIEGRVLAWLAGEAWKIAAFRAFDSGSGPDLYRVAASAIYGCPVQRVDGGAKSGPQRQVGKVAELALGFQGGARAFAKMGVNYGVVVAEPEADKIKTAWRERHPEIVRFWRRMEDAAMAAVEMPGTAFDVGVLRFKTVGPLLLLRLPSGRALAYVQPRIVPKEMPWLDDQGRPVVKDVVSYMGVDSYTRQWARCYGYGGLWAENATQAVARDVMAEAMLLVEAAGYPVVLSVHDEVVCEPDEDQADLGEFEDFMETVPHWATGLPVAAKGFIGKRYRK